LKRLVELGLLKEVKGALRFTQLHITTALKRRQKQILEKAISSLENDPIEIRSMTRMTIAIAPEKLPEAKKMILEFNREMSRFLESGNKKEVY